MLRGLAEQADKFVGMELNDPAIDFAAMFAQYDTLLMGRGTYEVANAPGKRSV